MGVLRRLSRDTEGGVARWWLGWDVLSAGVALGLGAVTVVGYSLATDDWDSLLLASLLAPAWGLLGSVWLVALPLRLWLGGRRPWRRWLVTPLIAGLALGFAYIRISVLAGV